MPILAVALAGVKRFRCFPGQPAMAEAKAASVLREGWLNAWRANGGVSGQLLSTGFPVSSACQICSECTSRAVRRPPNPHPVSMQTRWSS